MQPSDNPSALISDHSRFSRSATAGSYGYSVSTAISSNETFARILCDEIAANMPTRLTLMNEPAVTTSFVLPDCIRTNGSMITEISLEGSPNVFILSNFSHLPPSVKLLSITNVNIASLGDEDEKDGFTDGNLDWNEIWAALPNTERFTLLTSTVTGTIPPWLPAKMTRFQAVNAGLTGTISSGLFNKTTPSADMTLLMSGNNLSGSIPNGLITPWTGASKGTLVIDFSFCGLVGTIPSDLFQPLASVSTASFLINNNKLTGPLGRFPSQFGRMSFSFNAAFNRLSGTLPASIISLPQFRSIIFAVSSNMLSGSLPSQFFAPSWTKVGADTVTIDLTSNAFSGSIPPTFLTGGMALNGSVGDVPFSVNLAASHNPGIIGRIPEALFKAIPDADTSVALTLILTNTSVSGSPPASLCRRQNTMFLVLDNTKLNGAIPADWASGCVFNVISLMNCPNFVSTVPTSLFANSSVKTFYARNTPLYGLMPEMSATTTALDLSSTNIDFCGSSNASLSAWGYPIITVPHTCSFQLTSACACADNFDFACTVSPMCTPSSPSCDIKAQPGPEFTCVGGSWYAPTTNATTLIIPSGAGTVVITGNLPSQSVILQGLGTSVQVVGCSGNLTTITIELDPSQLGSLSTSSKMLYTLLTTSGTSCDTDLNSVNLITTAKSGCKKVKTQKVVSESGSTLSALFTLDNSDCNRWWIILVSVICGLILVGIIAVVLLAVFYAPFRQKIRPYSKNRAAEGAVGQ